MRWVSLVLWIAACFGVAGLGARWTAIEIPRWYRSLRQPRFTPPNWLFGPVWSLLYLLMAIAAWRVTLAPASQARTIALWLFVAQLALNLAWTYLFFHRHAIAGALGEILLLWATIGITMMAFGRIDPVAGWLMLPYLAWVSFASVLNGAIWRLNP